MSKIALLLCFLAVIAVCVFGFCFDDEPAETAGKLNRTHNKYVHRFEDPAKAARELEAAWKRFQSARGARIRTDGEPHGLTEEQIVELEQKMRQRLPADLRAFLKIYLSHGRFLNDLEFYSTDHLYSHWFERTELGFSMTWANCLRFGAPYDGEPSFCEHFVFNFASEHLEEIGYDLRNGKIIEVMDCDSGWMADSLTGLLNEMASHYEKGKRISRYDWEIEERPDVEKLRTEFLDSFMWHVYEKLPDEDQP